MKMKKLTDYERIMYCLKYPYLQDMGLYVDIEIHQYRKWLMENNKTEEEISLDDFWDIINAHR